MNCIAFTNENCLPVKYQHTNGILCGGIKYMPPNINFIYIQEPIHWKRKGSYTKYGITNTLNVQQK